MEKYDNAAKEEKYHDVEFNPTEFFISLWNSRLLILGVTVLFSMLAMGAVIHYNQYKSEGFLQFGGAIPQKTQQKEGDPDPVPGIMLSDYKRYSAAFSTSERFSEFIAQKNLTNNPDAIKLSKVFSSRNGIAKMIEPVYPFTKLDAKELMNDKTETGNNIIALNINYSAKDPKVAQNTVALLGQYAVDTIIYMTYSDMLRFKTADISEKITKLDNKIIENKEKLERFHRRGDNLKTIVTRYPQASSEAARQIVSVNEDNARYLSPVTQLMTNDVESADANEEIYKAKRKQAQYAILIDFYEHAKALLNQTKSGEELLQGLDPIKKNIFKDKNLEDETVREVYNLISIENENALNLYLNKTRFIAGPSLPVHQSTRLSLALALSILGGLFFSIVLVVLKQWWNENIPKKQKVPA